MSSCESGFPDTAGCVDRHAEYAAVSMPHAKRFRAQIAVTALGSCQPEAKSDRKRNGRDPPKRRGPDSAKRSFDRRG